VLGGPFLIEKYPMSHPRAQAWVAAVAATHIRDVKRDLANARYDRAKLLLQLNPSTEAGEEELDAYLGVRNVALGTTFTAKELRQVQRTKRYDMYERVSGYKIGSDELDEAVNRTIDAIAALDAE